MPVDTSAAESARSLLNGIDYSALIGGPLQAAITAQAMAANSTWEFIQQVGLDKEDANGNRAARNVTFVYQRDGEMVTLIVPLLVIVPIPLIVVDEISIDFTASINASASSTTENVSSQDIGGELEAEGKIGWGPFSLNARMKASYSSKQSSKATSDSRYSVEYTQVVRVHARQADMPAGLSTVLNILSSSATGGTVNGELSVSPPNLIIGPTDTPLLEIRTKSPNARNVASDVTISLDPRFSDCFQLTKPLTGETIAWNTVNNNLEAVAKTDNSGSLKLLVGLMTPTTQVPTTTPYPYFNISANFNGNLQETPVAINLALPAPTSPALTLNPATIDVEDTATSTGTVTINGGAALANATIATAITAGFSAAPTAGSTSTMTLDADGVLEVTITRTAQGVGITPAWVEFIANDNASLTATATIIPSAPPMQDVIRLSALRQPSRVRGLTAQPESTRQTWTVVRDGESLGVDVDAPVRVYFASNVIRVRCNGDPLESGAVLHFDEQNTAQLEFEARAGSAVGETQVVLETEGDGGRERQVFPVRIS